MNPELKKIENCIKKQAEMFLLEQGGFYPFGCSMDKNLKIKPLGVYMEGSDPSVIELTNLIENVINQKLINLECQVAAIAIDVTFKENNDRYDAIEMRIFEKDKKQYTKYIKYKIIDKQVEFDNTEE